MTKQQALQNNLADEVLLWSEEPEATAYFGWEAIFGILFSLFWLAMAAYGFSDRGNEGFNPFGFLFIAVGVFVLASSFWKPLIALYTIYGITQKRLLIVRHFPWGTEIESYFKTDIDFIKKIEKSSGKGHIVFTTIKYTGNKGRIRYEDIGFFGIDEVNSVEALIIKTFRSAKAP